MEEQLGEHYYDYNNPAVYTCNWCDGYVRQSRKYACDGSYNKQSVEEAIQRKILKVVGVTSSLYSFNKKTLIAGSNINGGVGKKHDSYARYLSKKTHGHLKTKQGNNIKPVQGNKTKAYSIIKNCNC
jgi:hypothetical protein